MADRYEAFTIRESNGKKYYTKLGVMFPNRNGGGFSLALDAMPASVDGQYRIVLFEPKPRDDRERSANGDRQQARERSSRQDQWAEDAPF